MPPIKHNRQQEKKIPAKVSRKALRTSINFHGKDGEELRVESLTIRHGRHAPTMPIPISARVTNHGSTRLLVRSALCLK